MKAAPRKVAAARVPLGYTIRYDRYLTGDPDNKRSCRKLTRQSAHSMLALQEQQARTGE